MYTLYRAYVMARTASGTLRVIYGGEVIYHLDRALGTGFLTLHTADTAVGAYLTNLCALIVAAALYSNLDGVVNKADYTVGTFLNAQATAYALSRIYFRYALFFIYADSASRTYAHTVTVAEAGKGTVAVTGVAEIRRLTGLRAGVNVLTLRGLTGSVTGNVGNLLDNVAGRESHNFCNLLCNSVTTGDAERGIVGSTLTECLSISVTSGEATRTAVSTGETVTHCRYSLILLNAEEDGGECKNNSTYYSDNNED